MTYGISHLYPAKLGRLIAFLDACRMGRSGFTITEAKDTHDHKLKPALPCRLAVLWGAHLNDISITFLADP